MPWLVPTCMPCSYEHETAPSLLRHQSKHHELPWDLEHSLGNHWCHRDNRRRPYRLVSSYTTSSTQCQTTTISLFGIASRHHPLPLPGTPTTRVGPGALADMQEPFAPRILPGREDTPQHLGPRGISAYPRERRRT